MDVLGFAIMGNHFHLVVKMYPESEVMVKLTGTGERVINSTKLR